MADASPDDERFIRQAISLAWQARTRSSPNPWVGCVLSPGGFEGATAQVGGPHAEATALIAAASQARGSTVYTTLEPCATRGRTPSCAQALIDAGVERVVVGIVDPDHATNGNGLQMLRAAGIEVSLGVCESEVREQLAPYLKQRTTGLPFVVAKMATTLDGRVAAANGTSKWITGEDAREDAHRLRAQSDAVVVGAGTVRTDDPELTVRMVEGNDPRRVVLGAIPAEARVRPAEEWKGSVRELMERLGGEGVLQVLVEGGPSTIRQFHEEGLVDRYVLYIAPKLAGDGAVPLYPELIADTMANVWQGKLLDVRRLGNDIRVDIEAA